MNITTGEELLRVIQMPFKKIVIYGAGYVAKLFYKSLLEGQCEKNVICFAATKGESYLIEGLPVVGIDEIAYDEEMVICVAVHESIKEELINCLEAKGFFNYVWIYPFLYEIMLGSPLACDVRVALKQIWDANKKNYAIAARYLAIEHYFGKNNYGYDIYKKCISLFSSESTAKRRLDRFIDLIQNWEKNGYNESKASSLLEDCMCVDGVHRIALAIYFNQRYVICNIYSNSKTCNEVHEKGVVLSPQNAVELGLDESIIRLLEDTNKRIEERYL